MRGGSGRSGIPRALIASAAAILTGIVLTASSVTGRSSVQPPLQAVVPRTVGDVTRDGAVSAADALAILTHVVGSTLPGGFIIDPDGDAACLDGVVHGDFGQAENMIVPSDTGPITAVDALVVLRSVVGLPVDRTCVGFQPDPDWAMGWNTDGDTLTVMNRRTIVRPNVWDTVGPPWENPWTLPTLDSLLHQALFRVRAVDEGVAIVDTLFFMGHAPFIRVSPRSPGTTEIVANWFSREITMDFHVLAWEPDRITVAMDGVPWELGTRYGTLEVGDSTRVRARAHDTLGYNQLLGADSVTWTSRDPSVLTVSPDGVVWALGAGQVWIVGEWSTHSDSVQVWVPTDAWNVEALISSSFNQYFRGHANVRGPGLFLSNAAFQHNAPWANYGMEQYGRIPRIALVNDASNLYYPSLARLWVFSYRVLSALAEATLALDDSAIAAELGADAVTRGRAFGKFVQGMTLGAVALLYDQGFIVDETTGPLPPQAALDLSTSSGREVILPDQPPPPVPKVLKKSLTYGSFQVSWELQSYPTLMDAALSYLDEAISIASDASFTLPYYWMQADVNAQDLVRLAHSYKARLRAQVARTPAERSAIDWSMVAADVDAGITSTHYMDYNWDAGWNYSAMDYGTWPNWSQLAYFMYGMADQSGNYQEWLSLPLEDKSYRFADDRDVLIITPDLRFPQGTTIDDQRGADGHYFRVTPPDEQGNTWERPERGTWRWSWYKDGYDHNLSYGWQSQFSQPEIQLAEMHLLKAEALYRAGDLAGAAAIINETRTSYGLNSTDASGTNTSCVPRLPDGSCGNLWEMLKWEKRMETTWTGVAGNNWWFDGRGWGDLWKDSPLQFPIPCLELEALMMSCYTFGGPGGAMGSPGSTYSFPFEG